MCVFLSFAGTLRSAEERGLRTGISAEREVKRGTFHLLVIGIDEYEHWPKLQTAVNDAKAVASVLSDQYGFDAVHTLYNAQAARSKIMRTLKNLIGELDSHDSLLIFYSGHGHFDEVTKSGAWIPVDAKLDDDSAWIDNAKIKSYIRVMKARHVLLISDSCFSGDFFRSMRGAPPAANNDYVAKAFGLISRQAITSGGLEPVTDAGFADHSVFTYFLLKQLEENDSACLVSSDLFYRIKGGVAANARQQPVFGRLHDTGGEIGGEFVLFREGKGRSQELDALLQERQRDKTMRPKTSYLQLTIAPSSASAYARVYVDGRKVDARNPIQVSADTFHSIQVKAKGYLDYSENWRAATGVTGLVNIRLIEKRKEALTIIW